MRPRQITAGLLAILLGAGATHAKNTHPERYYQQAWCQEHQGQAEVVLPDGARVDCLTETHAVEVDFAPKWAESIGQSLYYAQVTGKKPGVVLIMERPGDERHRLRLDSLAPDLGITIWLANP